MDDEHKKQLTELLRGFSCVTTTTVYEQCQTSPLPDTLMVPEYLRKQVEAEQERIAELGGVERLQEEATLHHRILHANSPVLVIAGDYKQYMTYLGVNGISPSNARYMRNGSEFKGHREYVLVFTGTYWNKLYDFEELELLKKRATWVID